VRGDQRCDRGERAFARADVVCRRRHKAEFIADVWDGEVCVGVRSPMWKLVGTGSSTIHLVVHDYAGLGYHDMGAEGDVDGGGQRKGQA